MGHNENIYGEFARIYDAEMARLGFHEKWNMLFDRLRLPAGRAIDMACGTGTIALELARRGWTVEAVDASEGMLAAARARPGAGAVRWTHGDMRTFEARGRVDLVTCAFDSVNYLLGRGDLRACFGRVAAHLAPGGCFLFDAITPWGQRAAWGDGVARVRRGPRSTGIWESRLDPPLSHLTLTYFEDDGGGVWRRWEEVHTERGWSLAALRRSALLAGLEVRGAWDGATLREPARAAVRVHLLCGLASGQREPATGQK